MHNALAIFAAGALIAIDFTTEGPTGALTAFAGILLLMVGADTYERSKRKEG